MFVRCSLPSRVSAALVLGLLSLLLAASSPAHAQGTWQPWWSPCDSHGNLIGNGTAVQALQGTATGSASGTPAFSAYLRYEFSPNAQTMPWLYPPKQGTTAPAPDTLNATANNDTVYYDDPGYVLIQSQVSADVAVTKQCYFLWNPIYTNASGSHSVPPAGVTPPPAPPMPVLLTSHVRAAYNNVYSSNAPFPRTGLTSSATTVLSTFGDSATVTSVDPSGTSFLSQLTQAVDKGRLMQIAPDGRGVVTVAIAGTLHAQAVNPVSYATFYGIYGGEPDYDAPWYPATAQATSTLTATAQQDTRAVTISASVDPTHTKTPLLDASGNQTIDANGDPNYTAAPNVADPNGTMHGDTIYSYHSYIGTSQNGDLPQDSPEWNWIYFTPHFVGGWHWKAGTNHNQDSITVPNVVNPDTWSWSPNESEDTWDYGKCSMSWATNYSETNGIPTGQDAPTVYNGSGVVYAATDNTDGASITAKYIMTVHDPIEKNYPDHATYRNKENFKKYPDAQWVSSGSDPGKTYDLDVHTDTSQSIDITITPGGKIEKLIASALGVTVDVSASFDISVGQGTVIKDVPPGYGTYCMSYEVVDYHIGKVDQWGTGGYQGTAPYNLRIHENPAIGIQPAPLAPMSGAPPTPPG